MEFGHRLKSLRLEAKITQQDLASMVGVSVVAVRNWERGARKPSMDGIISLGSALNVSLDTLLGIPKPNISKNSFILTMAERKLLETYQSLDSHGKRVVRAICALEKERVASEEKPVARNKVSKIIDIRERYIPCYITPSAAGFNAPLDGTDFEMILVDDNVPSDADFAVNIQGNSMSPYIKDGDMVYVRKDEDLSIGDVGIFCVDGAMYCKQYYMDDEQNLLLVSANPDLRHTNLFISADSGISVNSYGRVLLKHRVELPDYLFEN